MATYYVSAATGDDADAGTLASEPKQTIVSAFAAASAGDMIMLIDPYGTYVENTSALGYLNCTQAGVFVAGAYPKRRPTITGVSGTYSVRVNAADVVWSNLDFSTSNDACTSIVNCTSSTSFTGWKFYNVDFVVNHSVSTAMYMLVIQGTGAHDNWHLTDCKIEANGRSFNGGILISNADNFRMTRSTALLPRYSVGSAFRSTGANDIFLESCEFDGNWGFRQDSVAASSLIRLVDCKVYGRSYASLIQGTSSGTQTIVARRTTAIGDGQGFVLDGANISFDVDGLLSVASNMGFGGPSESSTNVDGVISNSNTAVYGTTGHGLLVGNGAVNVSVINHQSSTISGGYAAVIKGDKGTIHGGNFIGGTNQTLLLKGATNWTARDVFALQNVGGSLLEMRNGDSSPIASGNDVQGSTFIVSNGSLFDIGDAPQEDGTSIVDRNQYLVHGDGTWGTIKGTTVGSLAESIAAWDATGTNDANSLEDVVFNETSVDAIEVGGGGSGTGSRNVVVTVRNQADALVANARLQIKNSAGDIIAGIVGNTNSQGVATFYLDDGSYQVVATHAGGYQANATQSFVVNAPDISVALGLQSISVAEPTTPNTCICTLALIDQNGQSIDGAVLTSTPESPAFIDDALVHFPQVPATSVDGVVTTELVRGVRYSLQIKFEGKSIGFSVRIPDADSFIMKPVSV
jgi:hypothetical protein